MNIKEIFAKLHDGKVLSDKELKKLSIQLGLIEHLLGELGCSEYYLVQRDILKYKQLTDDYINARKEK